MIFVALFAIECKSDIWWLLFLTGIFEKRAGPIVSRPPHKKMRFLLEKTHWNCNCCAPNKPQKQIWKRVWHCWTHPDCSFEYWRSCSSASVTHRIFMAVEGEIVVTDKRGWHDNIMSRSKGSGWPISMYHTSPESSCNEHVLFLHSNNTKCEEITDSKKWLIG